MIEESGHNQKPGKWAQGSEPFLKAFPTIAQYCTDFWWEKTNKPRIPCTLSITFFGEAVQLTMNDKEKDRSMHTVAPTVLDALELMESHLAAGNAPWRSWGKRK
jgi:hypothetical protein